MPLGFYEAPQFCRNKRRRRGSPISCVGRIRGHGFWFGVSALSCPSGRPKAHQVDPERDTLKAVAAEGRRCQSEDPPLGAKQSPHFFVVAENRPHMCLDMCLDMGAGDQHTYAGSEMSAEAFEDASVLIRKCCQISSSSTSP